MSTDLDDRLHESMVSAEIPSYPLHLVEGIALRGRRTRRRRRIGTAAGAAAVGAAVITAALLQSPTGPQQPAAVPAPSTHTRWASVSVETLVRVASQPLTATLTRGRSASGAATLSLQRPVRPSDTSSTPTILPTSTEVGDAPGWVAVDVLADGVPTGDVIVFGLVPASGQVHVQADGRLATTTHVSDALTVDPAGGLDDGHGLLVARVDGGRPGTSVADMTVSVAVESEDGVLTPVPSTSPTVGGAPVDAGLTVSGVPVVLRLQEWPDGSSDLGIGVDGRVPDGADGLTPTTVPSTVQGPRGWRVAPVTSPDLTTTGTVVVFGYVEESSDVRVVVDGESWRPGSRFAPSDGGGITSAPGGGPFVFALAVDVPGLAGLDADDPRIAAAIGVQRRSADAVWVAVPRN